MLTLADWIQVEQDPWDLSKKIIWKRSKTAWYPYEGRESIRWWEVPFAVIEFYVSGRKAMLKRQREYEKYPERTPSHHEVPNG